MPALWEPRFPALPVPGCPCAARCDPTLFPPQTTVSWMPYLSIVCVLTYVIGHALGPSRYPELVLPPLPSPAP